jgi:hypothetical protein
VGQNHDDRVLSLVQTLPFDEGPQIFREWHPPMKEFMERRVVKTGNTHAGTAVNLVEAGQVWPIGGLAEPFVEGHNERVLLMGERSWHIVYDIPIDTWKKDGRAKARVPEHQDAILIGRGRNIASKLGLSCAGIDFIRMPNGQSYLLECNAYPALDEAEGAIRAFAETAAVYFGWR